MKVREEKFPPEVFEVKEEWRVAWNGAGDGGGRNVSCGAGGVAEGWDEVEGER